MPLSNCKIIELPKISDPRGNLTFIESDVHIPFEMKRLYYLYDVPGGADRGAHAHKRLKQFVIAMSGSFDITLNDGFSQKTFHLNRSYYGLYIDSMIWRDLNNFSSGAVCAVVASELYDPDEYIRDYDQFMKLVNLGKD